MSEDKAAGSTDAKDAKAAEAPASPEAEANLRMNKVQENLTKITQEIRTLEGRLNNRNPAVAGILKGENDQLKERVFLLQKALFGLLAEAMLPKGVDDANARHEALRQAAAEYCKKANLGEETWKSIASS